MKKDGRGNHGHKWKKGESGNPKGRPVIPKGSLEIRKLTAEELIEIGTTILRANDAEVERIFSDPNEPYINRIVASILKRTYEQGSSGQFDTMMNRIVGKPKEVVEHLGLKPSILVRQDGSEVHFTNQIIKKEEEE